MNLLERLHHIPSRQPQPRNRNNDSARNSSGSIATNRLKLLVNVDREATGGAARRYARLETEIAAPLAKHTSVPAQTITVRTTRSGDSTTNSANVTVSPLANKRNHAPPP
jgi:septum formation topological specificity factor MinE